MGSKSTGQNDREERAAKRSRSARESELEAKVQQLEAEVAAQKAEVKRVSQNHLDDAKKQSDAHKEKVAELTAKLSKARDEAQEWYHTYWIARVEANEQPQFSAYQGEAFARQKFREECQQLKKDHPDDDSVSLWFFHTSHPWTEGFGFSGLDVCEEFNPVHNEDPSDSESEESDDSQDAIMEDTDMRENEEDRLPPIRQRDADSSRKIDEFMSAS